MTKDEFRRKILLAWADDARERGHQVPDDSTLTTIAADDQLSAELLSAAVELWRPTIEWLLHQLKFGSLTPHTQLPVELLTPVAVPPPAPVPVPPPVPAPSPAPQTPLSDVDALKEWRLAAVQAGMPGITSLKETHLRQVASSQWRTPEEIKAAFKPVVGEFAEEIAAVLAGRREGGRDLAASSTPPPVAPVAHRAAAPADSLPAPSPTQPAQPAAAPARSLDGDVEPGGFAAYEFGPGAGTPGPIRFAAVDGTLTLQWEIAENPSVYRLVSADNHPPFTPDQAHLVAATTAGRMTDARPNVHAVRHFQVWRNEGVTVDDAKFAQPTLHASGRVIAPVLDLDVREDEGRVIGQWRVLDGTQRVQVFRIPMDGSGSPGDPQFRILADATNLGGFVDSGAERGKKYLYQIYTEAIVDGVAQLSTPSTVQVAVSVVHEPILDLAFTLHDDVESPFFDLSWTQPLGGRVVIYRTSKPPVAGIERGPKDESVLEQAGLTLDRRLAHPIAHEAGRAAMTQVPWPGDWARAYFTVVVIQDGVAFVGNTVRGVRVPPVLRPKFTERVSAQLVTFAWPEGADVVMVYKGPEGGDPEHAMEGPAIEVSQTDYRERGGLRLGQNTLDPLGGQLYLVSVAFDGGQRVRATPVSLSYPRLLRLTYRLDSRRSITGRFSALVSITSAVTLDSPPPFVLVHNADRLPLSVSDGTPVAMVRDLDGEIEVTRRFVPQRLSPSLTAEPGWRTDHASWQADVGKPRGFLRLFVDLPAEYLQQVALLDPPLRSLRLQSMREKAQGVFGG